MRTPSFFQSNSDSSWYYSVIKGYDKHSQTYSFEREGPFSNYYEAKADWAYTEELRLASMELYED